MPIGNLFKINQYNRNRFCTKVIDASAPSADFYFLMVMSTIIVAMGILSANIILVIGGMLVTPLLSPILALSLGIVINEKRVIIRSLRILLTALILAFIVSFITGLISHMPISQSEIIFIMKPSLFTLLIAIVAGLAASYAWVKPVLNDTLPGVAVTVTLIPPLTAIGLALARAEWGILRDVLGAFFLNIMGIILACILVFSLMEFYKAKRQAVEEVKEEEKVIKKEKKIKEINKEKGLINKEKK